MKRYALAALAAICIAVASSPAKAGTTTMATSFSSITVSGLDISSQTTTSILGGLNSGWKQACVQNLDTSNALYCGDNVAVSSITTNVLIGVIIAPALNATSPAQPTCFNVVENLDFFCRTGNVSGTSRAVIAKAR